MILNSPIISGSLTVTGNIITSGSITISGSIASASYASNADLLDGLDSTVFTLTSSFAAQTASFTAFTASLNAFSASQNSFTSSILAQTASLNSFSASILTFTGSASTRLGALESYTSSLNAKTASFATTGSNKFIGTQTITGSVLQSGSFTTTGTIIAQTINVQTVTSSIVYSCGNNIFGSTIGNTQVFTGSMFITGSNINANVGTACFAGTVCAQSIVIPNSAIIGANYSQNSQFAFTSTTGAQTTANITDAGTGCGVLTILAQGGTAGNGSALILGSDTQGSASSRGQIALKSLLTDGSGCGVSDLAFSFRNSSTCSNLTERLRITSTGVACFASTVCASSFIGAALTVATSLTGVGRAVLNSGDATHSGYINWYNSSVSRLGYMGYNNTDIELVLEGTSTFKVTGGVTCFACSVTATNNVTISSTTNASLTATTNSTTGYSFIDLINNGASGKNYQIGVGANGVASGYANNLYFDLVGTGTIMTLTSGRNIGINTTNFGERLNIGCGGAIAWQNTCNCQKWHIQHNSADGLNFVESSVADFRLFLKAGGNVGVGLSTPTAQLHICSAYSQTPLVVQGGGNGNVPIACFMSGTTQVAVIDDNANLIIGQSSFATRVTCTSFGLVTSG